MAKEFICEDCGKEFSRKVHLDSHKNKKFSCKNKVIKKHRFDIKLFTNNLYNKIDSVKIQESLSQNNCAYCNKFLSKRSNVISHMKNNCSIIKAIEQAKENILTKLQIENELLKKEVEDMKNNTNISVISTNNTSIVGSNTSTNNSNNTINTQIIDNSTNHNKFCLVNYNHEDMSKIDQNELARTFKRGFQTPVEMTKVIHFNPNYPENHNIYISKISETKAMVFEQEQWKIKCKYELIDDIHNNKKDYVQSHIKEIKLHLSEQEQKKLDRWLETDEEASNIKQTKEDIMNLLYDNREMAMSIKREMDKIDKFERCQEVRKIVGNNSKKLIK